METLRNGFFAYNQHPCKLDYEVIFDSGWRTNTTKISGWIGGIQVDLNAAVDPYQRWYMNGRECPDVDGCVDIDLGFSPSTNLLPIRRLSTWRLAIRPM